MSHTQTRWEVGTTYNVIEDAYVPVITKEARDIAILETAYGDADEHAAIIVNAVNSYQAMKEALELMLYEPMSERAVDKAKQALTLANGGSTHE